MDERAIKRLLVIIVASIIAIMVFKASLTKTIINLNKAAAEKKQAASAKLSATPQAPTPLIETPIIETPAVSAVTEVSTLDLRASSSVNETTSAEGAKRDIP